MRISDSLRRLALLAALTAAVPACSRDKAAGGEATAESIDALSMPSILKSVPAETPYYFAAVRPLSPEVRAKVVQVMTPVLAAFTRAVKAELERPIDPADPGAKGQRAFLETLAQYASFEGLTRLGFGPEKPFAIYGLGFLPAFRVELADPGAFKKFFADVEAKAGEPAKVETLGDQQYWVFGADSQGIAVLALVGDTLVGGLMPVEAKAMVLPLLLGQAQPQASLAEGDALKTLLKGHGLTGHGVGVVDVRAIVGTLVGEGTGTNADIYKALSPSMTPMTDVCRAEFKGLADKAPRLVFGNQSLTPTEARVAFTLELEPALGKMLQGLRAAVPGLSAKTDPSTFFQLGVGLDVDRAMTLAQERAAAVTAAPFQCEQLAGLNEVAAEVTRSLAMATAGPAAMVRLVRGFSLVVKDLVPPAAQGSTGSPPLGVSGAKAYAALATSNPEGVLATIKAFVPDLVSLSVAKDGKPVPLPTSGMLGELTAPHIAMGESALVLSTGEGMQAELTALTTAKGDESMPLVVFASDSGRLLNMQLESRAKLSANLPPEQQALEQAELEATRAVAGAVGHTAFVLTVGDKGLHLTETAVLK